MLKRIWKFICEMALVGGALLAFFALGGVVGQPSVQALAVTAALIAFTWGMMFYCAAQQDAPAAYCDNAMDAPAALGRARPGKVEKTAEGEAEQAGRGPAEKAAGGEAEQTGRGAAAEKQENRKAGELAAGTEELRAAQEERRARCMALAKRIHALRHLVPPNSNAYYLFNIRQWVMRELWDREKKRLGEPPWYAASDAERLSFELGMLRDEALEEIGQYVEEQERGEKTTKEKAALAVDGGEQRPAGAAAGGG